MKTADALRQIASLRSWATEHGLAYSHDPAMKAIDHLLIVVPDLQRYLCTILDGMDTIEHRRLARELIDREH